MDLIKHYLSNKRNKVNKFTSNVFGKNPVFARYFARSLYRVLKYTIQDFNANKTVAYSVLCHLVEYVYSIFVDAAVSSVKCNGG